MLKVTKADDPSGLPFVPSNQQGFAPCGKRIAVDADHLYLYDHKASHEIVLQPGWGITHRVEHQADDQAVANKETSWEGFFPNGVPAVSPQEAYSAVLLYPEDDAPIGELASQPFVADWLKRLHRAGPTPGCPGRASRPNPHSWIRRSDRFLADARPTPVHNHRLYPCRLCAKTRPGYLESIGPE